MKNSWKCQYCGKNNNEKIKPEITFISCDFCKKMNEVNKIKIKEELEKVQEQRERLENTLKEIRIQELSLLINDQQYVVLQVVNQNNLPFKNTYVDVLVDGIELCFEKQINGNFIQKHSKKDDFHLGEKEFIIEY